MPESSQTNSRNTETKNTGATVSDLWFLVNLVNPKFILTN
jgi:hypothetical protein